MTISRNTFDPAKNYKRVRYHQDRDLLDSELNEQQDITHLEHRKMWDLLIGDGFYMGDTPQPVSGNIVTMEGGAVYVDGTLEMVPGATLIYDPGKTSGVDVVYVELLKYNIDHTQDTALINPATGEPTAEREKWVLSYKATDTSGSALPNNVTERKVVPVLFGWPGRIECAARRPHSEIGFVGEFGGTLTRPLGDVAFRERLFTPNDAFHKVSLVSGPVLFPGQPHEFPQQLPHSHFIEPCDFILDVQRHCVFLPGSRPC